MGRKGRSGARRYPYPVSVGDVLSLGAYTRDDYHRLRSAAYKRADRAGHRLQISREGSTVMIRRAA